jgi:hypothetical protein
MCHETARFGRGSQRSRRLFRGADGGARTNGRGTSGGAGGERGQPAGDREHAEDPDHDATDEGRLRRGVDHRSEEVQRDEAQPLREPLPDDLPRPQGPAHRLQRGEHRGSQRHGRDRLRERTRQRHHRLQRGAFLHRGEPDRLAQPGRRTDAPVHELGRLRHGSAEHRERAICQRQRRLRQHRERLPLQRQRRLEQHRECEQLQRPRRLGWGCTASGGNSSVSGGWGSTASGGTSSVSGGQGRTAAGDSDWVAGGLFQDQ